MMNKILVMGFVMVLVSCSVLAASTYINDTYISVDSLNVASLCDESGGNCNNVSSGVLSGYWNLSGSDLYPGSLSYNVGIGTNSPSTKFDVSSDVASGSNLVYLYNSYGGGGGRTLYVANAAGNTNELVRFENTGAGHLALFMGNGNVGIGAASPGEKLHVNGSINVTSGNDVCISGGNCLSSVSGGSEIWNNSGSVVKLSNLAQDWYLNNGTVGSDRRIYWNRANTHLVFEQGAIPRVWSDAATDAYITFEDGDEGYSWSTGYDYGTAGKLVWRTSSDLTGADKMNLTASGNLETAGTICDGSGNCLEAAFWENYTDSGRQALRLADAIYLLNFEGLGGTNMTYTFGNGDASYVQILNEPTKNTLNFDAYGDGVDTVIGEECTMGSGCAVTIMTYDSDGLQFNPSQYVDTGINLDDPSSPLSGDPAQAGAWFSSSDKIYLFGSAGVEQRGGGNYNLTGGVFCDSSGTCSNTWSGGDGYWNVSGTGVLYVTNTTKPVVIGQAGPKYPDSSFEVFTDVGEPFLVINKSGWAKIGDLGEGFNGVWSEWDENEHRVMSSGTRVMVFDGSKWAWGSASGSPSEKYLFQGGNLMLSDAGDEIAGPLGSNDIILDIDGGDAFFTCNTGDSDCGFVDQTSGHAGILKHHSGSYFSGKPSGLHIFSNFDSTGSGNEFNPIYFTINSSVIGKI